MIVFKNYLRIAKTYLPIIIIYSAIFITFAIFASTSGSMSSGEYQSTKTKIAIINNDTGSTFIENFEEYIDEKAQLVKIDSDEESLKDALFFRKVDYIMTIPKNYTMDFMAKKDVKIETMQVPDSYTSTYSKTLMNKYLNTANVYLAAGIDDATLASKVKQDLNQEAKVEMTVKENSSQVISAASFYNFANYTLLAIIVVIVAMIMVSFNQDKIKRRNLVSPVSYKSLNRQLLLGNIVVSFGVWLVYAIASFVLYPEVMTTTSGLLLLINSAIFTIFVLVFSFFVSSLTNNREVISGVSNVVGLGSSFIGGAFVPQAMLGSFVLGIAKFTPTYWYIKANNDIAKLTEYSFESIKSIIFNMIVVLGFALLFYIIIQVFSRLRLKK